MKLFSFFFNKPLTYLFMFLNATLMKLSSAFSAGLELLWVNFVLCHIEIIFFFYLSNTLFLQLFISCLNFFNSLFIF